MSDLADPRTKIGAPASRDFDVVIVGAGFAGMYMLHRLRGLNMSVRVIESAGGVGGTWYWNRYPGARCDVESMQYSYSFSSELQQEWTWSELFAAQPEILRYANFVADRLDLKRDIQFDTRVTSARFDDAAHRWDIATDRGEAISACFCVMATGCLSNARVPDFKGLESFKGSTYHTGQWPHEGVDLSGKRVGVIGTGSSAIQAIPVIAEQAAELVVFQRTPNFSIPSRNGPMTQPYEQSWKQDYATKREKARTMRTGILYQINEKSAIEMEEDERRREYEARWAVGGTQFMASFSDLLLDKRANDTAAEFVRDKIRTIVKDPVVAELLAPKTYPIGTKRICVDTEYFATYNRPHVKLVDVRASPIAEITPDGVRTAATEYALDAIVFATGFDAMTGAMAKIDICGVDGVGLREKWEAGPRTYLGLMTAGFPNLFMITGPGSPSVLSNMIVSIEQHVDWITDCVEHLQSRQLTHIEAAQDSEDEWVFQVNEVAHRTLYPHANSWYMGANVPGKPRVFMPYVGGVGVYRQTCDEVVEKGYEGFILNRRADEAEAAD